MKIVTDQTPFSIAPADIDTERHFYGAFGRREREISARYIVGLYQQNGGWKPFTAGEIEAFYKGCGLRDGFWFNGLDHDGFVVLGEDGMYRVTEEFITRCFTSSPAK